MKVDELSQGAVLNRNFICSLKVRGLDFALGLHEVLHGVDEQEGLLRHFSVQNPLEVVAVLQQRRKFALEVCENSDQIVGPYEDHVSLRALHEASGDFEQMALATGEIDEIRDHQSEVGQEADDTDDEQNVTNFVGAEVQGQRYIHTHAVDEDYDESDQEKKNEDDSQHRPVLVESVEVAGIHWILSENNVVLVVVVVLESPADSFIGEFLFGIVKVGFLLTIQVSPVDVGAVRAEKHHTEK